MAESKIEHFFFVFTVSDSMLPGCAVNKYGRYYAPYAGYSRRQSLSPGDTNNKRGNNGRGENIRFFI